MKFIFPVRSLILVVSCLFTLVANAETYRIKSAWLNDGKPRPSSYIHVEKALTCSASLPDEQSSWWIFEKVEYYDIYRINNVWRKELFLHVENGSLVCGTILTGWQSAWWTLEKADNGYFIRNYYRKDQYLHIQEGDLKAGPISKDWHSACWLLQRVQ